MPGIVVEYTGDPQQAPRLATQQPVHLLLTDVVMPLPDAALAVRSPDSPSA
jgi:YesN/AraC family two-component response regulator